MENSGRFLRGKAAAAELPPPTFTRLEFLQDIAERLSIDAVL